MKPGKPGKRKCLPAQAASTLAGVVGHELNNIAVPLDGFAELARQEAGASESLLSMLTEIKIAIARIQVLAEDLESLGTTGAEPEAVAIRECLPPQAGGDAELGIDWQCSPTTAIEADAGHARRALQALAAMTGPSGVSFGAGAGWRIATEPAGTRRCAACGAAPVRGTQVVVQAFCSRAVSADALREPLSGARIGRSSRRLSLPVLVHSAHCAGGHVLLDEAAGSLSLSFPTA